MGTYETQTQRLARQHVATIADTAISNIERMQKIDTYIVYGVMFVSFFHQFTWLFKRFMVAEWFQQGTIDGYLHAVTYAAGAAILPLLFDVFTIVCVTAISTVGLKSWVKKLALALLIAPVAASGYVNFMSSVDPDGNFILGIAIIYLIAVAFIPLTELMRAASHAIDYPAIEAMERRALAQVEREDQDEPVAEVAAPLDPMEELVLKGETRAKELVEYDRMTPEQRQSWTRRFKATQRRMARELADPVASVQSAGKDAPVSPAGPLA